MDELCNAARINAQTGVPMEKIIDPEGEYMVSLRFLMRRALLRVTIGMWKGIIDQSKPDLLDADLILPLTRCPGAA